MRSTKHSSLLAAVNAWIYKPSPGSKGRSNDKVSKRYKDRDRKKAAHKARMAQKGRK
jgi:hypothetical protein